jgi:hypothetical protein
MPIALTLATDGQPAQQLTLPTAWPEVTLAQYLAAHAPGSPHAPALRLSGLADAVLDELPADQADELAYHLVFASDEAALAALLPTPGLLEIGLSAYGLYELAQQWLAATPDAHPLAFGAYLHALYREPVGFRPAPANVEAAHAAVLARPVTEAYADCLYFLASYQRAGTGAPAVGVAQAGLLRLVRPQAPASGLLPKLGQLLGLPTGSRRNPETSLIR